MRVMSIAEPTLMNTPHKFKFPAFIVHSAQIAMRFIFDEIFGKCQQKREYSFRVCTGGNFPSLLLILKMFFLNGIGMAMVGCSTSDIGN